MAASHITDFIQSLNSEELKIVTKHLTRSKDKTKIGKLLTLLTKEPKKGFSDKELGQLMDNTAATIRVLKSRLFDNIKEALVLNEYFENGQVFNHREQIVFTLKKKILLIKTLFRTMNQGKTETINFLLSETIKIAKENEVYDVLIESLIVQKHQKGIRLGSTEFENITNQIVFYDYCLKCVRNANDAYYRLILSQGFVKSLTNKELEKHLKQSIQQMEIDFQKTKSQEVNYYKHLFEIALSEQEKKFKQAITLCQKLIAMIKKSTVQYSRDRVGFAMSNLSMFNVFTGDYKEAVKYAKIAQEYHIPHSLIYLIMKEQEFYAYFYASIFKDASICIEEMLNHSMADTGEYRKSKFIYYQACILFATKQFKEALQLLNKSLEIEKDKTGWNIALRILNILVFIELKKIDGASRALEAVRKYTERLKKSNEVKERDILIIKFLREMEKDRFRYDSKNVMASKILKELSEKDKPTSWNYYTPELIPFHEWVVTLPMKR